jgi:hypothetical protein
VNADPALSPEQRARRIEEGVHGLLATREALDLFAALQVALPIDRLRMVMDAGRRTSGQEWFCPSIARAFSPQLGWKGETIWYLTRGVYTSRGPVLLTERDHIPPPHRDAESAQLLVPPLHAALAIDPANPGVGIFIDGAIQYDELLSVAYTAGRAGAAKVVVAHEPNPVEVRLPASCPESNCFLDPLRDVPTTTIGERLVLGVVPGTDREAVPSDLGLLLAIAEDFSFYLATKDGLQPRIPSENLNPDYAALQKALRALKDAAPRERAVLVLAGPLAPSGEVLRAAAAASADQQGELFPLAHLAVEPALRADLTLVFDLMDRTKTIAARR